MDDDSGLFSDRFRDRFKASVTAPQPQRDRVARTVMKAAGLPTLGTSGAANAYVLLLGSEFGAVSSTDRPHYSVKTMGKAGWKDLWRLRIGERHPHFDERWALLSRTTTLWDRLCAWLPGVFDDAQLAYSMFGWANLSVTPGGDERGTRATHAAGMREHVAPLIEASGAHSLWRQRMSQSRQSFTHGLRR